MLRDTYQVIQLDHRSMKECGIQPKVPFAPPLCFPTAFQQQDPPPAHPWSTCEREGASRDA